MGHLFYSQNITKEIKDPFWNAKIVFFMRNNTPRDFLIQNVTLVYDISYPQAKQDTFRQTDPAYQNYPWGMQGDIITYEMFNTTKRVNLYSMIIEGSGPMTGGFRIFDPEMSYDIYLDQFQIDGSKFIYNFIDYYYVDIREDFANLIIKSLMQDIDRMSVGTSQPLEILKIK